MSFGSLLLRGCLASMLVCLTSVTAAQVTLTAGSAGGDSGTSVDLPITVQQFNGIVAAQGTVSFDPAVAEFDGVFGFGLPGFTAANVGTGQTANGQLTFAWTDQTFTGVSVPDQTAIFMVRFNLIGANGTQSTIDFQNSPTPIEFVDATFTALPFVTNPGVVFVGPQAAQVDVTAGLAIGAPGEQVDIPISVAQFNQIAAARGSLFWNVGMATYDSTHEFGLPNFSTQNINTTQIANGRLGFDWNDPKVVGVSVPDNTTIFTVRFNLIGSIGAQTPIEFQNTPTPIEFINNASSVLPFTVNPGGITIVAPADAVFSDGFEQAGSR